MHKIKYVFHKTVIFCRDVNIMNNAYSALIKKLDLFIRKYYKNQILKGILLFLSFSLALFLILTILENFAYFNSTVRTVLFYTYIVVNVFVLIQFIIIPLFRLFKIGKVISYEQAAKIIGEHFTEVKDKLLNTLQLKQISDTDTTSLELINAGIEQKISTLSPVQFNAAVDFKVNKKLLKFLLPPAIILLVILIASPAVLTEPTKRYYNYSTFYEKQAPFQFVILNKSLEAVQQQDFVLNVKLTGDDIPGELFVVYNENEYSLNKENVVVFNYTFKNLQKDLTFYLKADEYRSRSYTLKVIPKPIILDFEVQLNYPAYTGKKNEVVENSGDLSVPAGTNICWKLLTKDTKKILLKFVDKSLLLEPVKNEVFLCSRNFLTSQNYTVIPQNQFIKKNDSLTYSINVIPDAYPMVDVTEYRDSVYYSHLYFKGFIKDDYGFNKLLFKYRILKQDDDDAGAELSENITFNKQINQGEFYHYFDVSALQVSPGDQIEYYFEIWDNDGVNGSKAARSSKMMFKIPTENEMEKQAEQNSTDLKNKMDEAIKDISLLQKQADDINRKMLDKKNLSWQERRQIEDLLIKQQQLQQNVENIKEQLHENMLSEQQFQKPDSSILEKQKQLEDLFNKIMTDEMKELFRQMQEMLDKLDKTKVNEMLDKIKMNNKDLEKELDRNLELFKQLELEKKMSETIEKLQKLAEEQKELSDKTADDKQNQQDLLDEQRRINDDFEQVKQNLQNLEKLNKELEDPKKLDNTDDQQQAIQEELNNSKNNLENNKRKNASKSQKSAGDKMQNLADDLMKMQEEMAQEELAEDEQALRQLLENLINVSFSQEELINRLKTTNINNPKYLQIMDKQKELKDDLKMIEDSLFALSKRQSIIEPIVNKEISAINENVVKILEALHNRNIAQSQKWQQYVMTSVNNLALLLAESLQQMQQQMQSMSKSCNKKGGKCSKPGNGKPSASSMKQMQDQLNKQMEALKKQLESGQKPGQGGQQSMSEQLARLAAQQEALRKMLQQYGEEQKKEGAGNAGQISDMMKKMEQTETDLVNKIINNETIKRQQEILTRLLESEKAEKERELDEKRKSNEAIEKNYSNPNQFFEYNRLKSKELELLKTIPVTLTPFFKYKTNEYFYKFDD